MCGAIGLDVSKIPPEDLAKLESLVTGKWKRLKHDRMPRLIDR